MLPLTPPPSTLHPPPPLSPPGVNHQGVYRLPGVKSKVEELKSHFDKGQPGPSCAHSVDRVEGTLAAGEVVDLSEQDPNTVASLLKLYLRELPEPLIPHSSLSSRADTILGEWREEVS